MWTYNILDKFWYRQVTSGLVTLIFTIEEENGKFVFNFLGNQFRGRQYHCNTIDQAKETANQDIKYALRWT